MTCPNAPVCHWRDIPAEPCYLDRRPPRRCVCYRQEGTHHTNHRCVACGQQWSDESPPPVMLYDDIYTGEERQDMGADPKKEET